MMLARLLSMSMLIALSSAASAAVDLSKIERKIVKEPVYRFKPKYCLLVLGAEAKMRVWLVQDGDTLYLDRNGNGDLTEWDVAGGKRRTILHSGNDYYGVPIFSPDGRSVAVDLILPKGQPPEVRLWEIATGKEIGTFTAPKEALSFNQLAFSPDGRRLAASTEAGGKVFLYDVQARKFVWVQDVEKNRLLRDPVFSPDGKWLAVPGQPRPEDVHLSRRENPLDLPQPRVFLFDLSGDNKPDVLVAPHGFVGRAAFSSDGRTLALGGYGCVWLFDVAKTR